MSKHVFDTNTSSSKRIIFATLACIAVLLVVCALFSACGPKTFTVTFIQGDTVSTRIVKKGQNVTNLPYLEQKSGYTVKWDRSKYMNVQSDVTVYAIETPNEYKITYDLGEVSDAQITSTSQNVTFDSTFTLYTPVSEGNTFLKWVVSGTDTEFTSGIWNVDHDVTLVAVWESNKLQTFTVTFVQGTTTFTRVVEQGGSVTDIPTPEAKRGYTVTWEQKDLTNIQQDITVCAVETANSYTITYKLGDASNVQIASLSQKVTFDSAFTLYTPTSSDSKFVKWVVSGTDTEFTSGIWNVDHDVTLVAVWESTKTQTFTVTFVQGTTTFTRVVEMGGSVTDIPTPETKRGYTVMWEQTDLTNVQQDITVRAVETANEYTIFYKLGDVDDAQITALSQKVTFDSTFTLYTPVSVGNTFLKWIVSGTDTEFTSGIWNVDHDVTLVAVWESTKPQTFTVTFVQGTTTFTRVVEMGGSVTDIPTPETKRGYTVMWEQTDLTNVQQDITVRAVETANEYTIFYKLGDVDDAQITALSQKVTFDSAFTLYTPTSSDGKFVKWVVRGTDTEFTSGTYTLDSDVTLVAVWEQLPWSEFH